MSVLWKILAGLICLGFAGAIMAAITGALGAVSVILVVIVAAVMAIYSIVAAVVGSYDLSTVKGWLLVILDCTWSLPNTLFGAIIGLPLYLIFGSPSKVDSEGKGWISYKPRSSSGFGTNVLQTLGTVNLGGAGQHERMHLAQARIFGPLYLPLFAVFYVVTFLLQGLFTLIIGLILKATKVRDTAYLRPPSSSAVQGYFGWIYYATPFEVWAYASGNP